MKYLCLLGVFIFSDSLAQKYSVVKSQITFFSEAVLENITATAKKSSGLLNLSNSEFAFSVPIKEFQFRKSLMKEHFNEKYMESEKYPRATFAGKMSGFDAGVSSQQSINASGKLTIHGVTREVEIPATIVRSGKGYAIHAEFIVKLEDYKISSPQLLLQNIAEQVKVTVDFMMTPQ